MKKVQCVALLCAMLCFSGAAGAAVVDTVEVPSASMNRSFRAYVFVPDAAARGERERFPVVYLLHGHSGNADSWPQVKPELAAMVDRDGIIVVCPEVGNSWYWNSPVDPSSRFETFVSDELIGYVDARYPTIADRKGRAVTGLSMGGHGGMWIGIRHRDLFGAAGSTSGGLDIRPFPDNWNMKSLLGDPDEYPERWDAHTAINLIDSLSDGELAIIVDCGYGDFFFEVNNRFHEKLLERGIGHDFIVRPGAHNGAYWANALDYQWLFFKKFFDRAAAE